MKKSLFVLLLSLAGFAHAQSGFIEQIQEAEAALDKQAERATEILAQLDAQFALSAKNMNDNELNDARYRLDWLHRRFGFSLEDIDIARDQDNPDVCLQFNRAVLPQPMQDWAGKIKLTPAADGGWRYMDDQLCFTGKWASNYQLEIDSTLRSDNHVALKEGVVREIATGDRDPMLRFASLGQVLALQGDQRIALESTNVRQVRLQLWHFPREALANDTLREALLDPQSRWSDFKDNNWMRTRARNIFSGTFSVNFIENNKLDSSSVRFADMLGDKAPDMGGFYLLNAWNDDGTHHDDYYDGDSIQTQVFTLSTTGLSAYRTDEGLWVEARNLLSTAPVAGLEIGLYAKSGALIAKVRSDKQGMAQFSRAQIAGEDGDAPAHVIGGDSADAAEHGMTYLYLDGAGFDLADKGLQGEVAPQVLRHWSWVDRGVYRPGETLHALWVVKDRDMSPFAAPLWLTVRRPDGIVLLSRSIAPDASGAYSLDYDFASDAALGNWQIGLRLGRDGEWVSTETVRVDSILPQTLEASAKPASPVRSAGQTRYLLHADWLYGAPAAEIDVEAAYTVRPRRSAIPGYEGWQVGRHDEVMQTKRTALSPEKTNAKGDVEFGFTLPENIGTRPQEIALVATLLPRGGRPLDVDSETPVERSTPYVALRTEGKGAEVAVIDDHGKAQQAALTWTIYNLNYHYYWYRHDGRWQYRENVSRAATDSGTLQVSASAPAVLELPVGTDSYAARMLEVVGDNPQIAASVHLGYRPEGDATAPDRIRFADDAAPAPYRKGDKVSMRLFAPFDGQGSVHLATDGIVDTLPVAFKEGIADIEFTWQSGWDGGLWLLASGYNADQSGARNRRAVGLTWLAADTSAYRLELQGDIPETIEPGGELHLGFSGEGWLNVAVIDDGLYQLGRATFADPLVAFFGKKRLPLALFDVWGSVIRQLGGDAVKLRSGADGVEENALSSALIDLPDIDMRNFIRFWSGPVSMQAGKAGVSVPIPEGFNGRLRVMAANFSDKRFGHLEQTLTVKAPLVTELRTPAYLTVQDRGEFLLRLHNTTDSAQTIQADVAADHITLEKASQNISLGAGESTLLAIPFTVQKAGETTLSATVQSGERRYTLTRTLTLRGISLPHYLTRYESLQGGETRKIALAPRSILEPTASLPWSADVLAESLRRYPYGCNEQITSRLTALGEDARLSPDDARKQALFRDLFNTLLNRQARNGAFGLWHGSGEELWLSAYVGETLLADGQAPFADDSAQGRLLRYLRSQVLEARSDSEFYDEISGIAYAHLLLARNGMDLRGALLNDSARLPQHLPLAPATLNMALAFAAYGDSERADEIIKRIDLGLDSSMMHRYADRLSEDGELLVRLHEWQQALPDRSGDTSAWQAMLIKRLGTADKQYLSTQAQSWLLRAARLYDKPGQALNLDGEALDARRALLKPASVTLSNPGSTPQYVAISELHYPAPEESASQGWTLDMRYENFDGKKLDPNDLPLHENILVHVNLHRDYDGTSDVIFTCPLPAGLAAVSATPDNDPLAIFAESEWYDKRSTPEMEENRDDRHIAAFRVMSGQSAIAHAFVLKAVGQGQWHAPACQVEDMYRPQHFARGKAQAVTVHAAP